MFAVSYAGVSVNVAPSPLVSTSTSAMLVKATFPVFVNVIV